MSNASALLLNSAATARSSGWGEARAWNAIGAGWKPLFGSFKGLGVSFEWHDFKTRNDLDWGVSFHPRSLEICLNLAGTGILQPGRDKVHLGPQSAGFYRQGEAPLRGQRLGGEHHQFITVEYSEEFIQSHFGGVRAGLHPIITAILSGHSSQSAVAEPQRLRAEHQQLIQGLRHPPVYAAAQPLWYKSKALELASVFFFMPPPEEALFCDRQKLLSQDRCEKVIALLQDDLASPPSLEDLGRKVGCSQFYLSRTFSKEMGMTIAQYLRKLRMDRAAELLRSGKFNVTQAAVEVGYSSLSHFSQAFHESFGCCPGLYGIAPDHGKK